MFDHIIFSAFGDFVTRMEMRRAKLADLDASIKAVVQDKTGQPYQITNGVGLIKLKGFMTRDVFFMDEVSTVKATNQFKQAARDDKVKSIMLVVDSPGGYTDGVIDLADAVYQARQVKPVVAVVEGMCCSAAYWVSSQASEIIAGPIDQIGSIGVRMAVYDYSEMFKEDGVRPVVIDTGEHKSTGLPGTVVTENQEKELQRLVDQTFDAFLNSVQRGRSMSREQVMKSANGSVWMGEDAINRGLIDAVGSFDNVFAQLAAANFNSSRTARARALIDLAKAKS